MTNDKLEGCMANLTCEYLTRANQVEGFWSDDGVHEMLPKSDHINLGIQLLTAYYLAKIG